ncbi:MAG: hypothetical protein KA408_11075 [Flavobacteriales bacterium]|nr:hypothetical protein [Flavobacteriales bacterium]
MKLVKALFIGAIVMLFAMQNHAQELDVEVGSPMEPIDDDRIGIGMDATKFYTLRIEKEKKDKLGFIEVWSRTTMQLESTQAIAVPVVNTDEFKILEVFVVDDGLRMYYAFFSKEDERRVLAMANFDRDGMMVGDATQLVRVEDSREKSLDNFAVKHFENANTTVIMDLKPFGSNTDKSKENTYRVFALDLSGKLLYDQQVELGQAKYCAMQTHYVDDNGNTFLRVSRQSEGEACKHLIVTVNARGVKEWCDPELLEGSMHSDDHQWVMDATGNMHYMNMLSNLSNSGYLGFVLHSFDKEIGEHINGYAHKFKDSYPPEDNKKPGKAAFMRYCKSGTASFQKDGTLNVYGYKTYLGTGKAGQDGVWKLNFDLVSGFGPLVGCEMERHFFTATVGDDFSSFFLHYLMLDGKDYIIANEIRDNIGKPCSSLVGWKAVKPLDNKTEPAYFAMNDGDEFGTRTALLPRSFGSAQSVHEVIELRGEEYIMRLEADSKEYWVRVRSLK